MYVPYTSTKYIHHVAQRIDVLSLGEQLIFDLVYYYDIYHIFHFTPSPTEYIVVTNDLL